MQAVNTAIGDTSWTAKYGERPDREARERDRIRVHLQYVEARLRAADVTALTEAQQDARRQALDVLAQYWRAGSFPQRTDDAYRNRRPQFIDDRGVRCAVGEMIAGTGYAQLAESIDHEHEFDEIGAIRTPGLRAWMQAFGFTEAELAMIQPSYNQPQYEADTFVSALYNERAAATLACARHHPATRSVPVIVRGDRRGNVKYSTLRWSAFARCFARQFEPLKMLGPADDPVRPFRVRERIKIDAPQEILERKLETIRYADGRCGVRADRPGPIPQEVRITVGVGKRGPEVSASTTPANADVEACITQDVLRRLVDFEAGRWRLSASVTRTIDQRLSDASLRRRLAETLPEAATACWDLGAPPRLSAKVDFDAERLDIELTGGNAVFQTCVRRELDRTLRTSMGFSVERDDGSIEDALRIDGTGSAKYDVRVESPAQRRERSDRESQPDPGYF